MTPDDLNDPTDKLTEALMLGADHDRAGLRPISCHALMARLGFTSWRLYYARFFRNAYGSSYRLIRWQIEVLSNHKEPTT